MTRSSCYISKSNFPGEGFIEGTIAYLKLYTGAMTQAEVTAAYEASPATQLKYY